jgi:lysine 2,3-aminomutase
MSQDLETRTEHRRTVSTSIVDEEVFEDVEVEPEVLRVSGDVERYLDILWDIDPEFTGILRAGRDREEVREAMYHLIDRRERNVFSLNSPLHVLEKATIRECARVLRSVFGPINEKTTKVSALDYLWRLARGEEGVGAEVGKGFVLEFIHLVRGLSGQSGLYGDRGQIPAFLKMEGREAAQKRTEKLDEMSRDLRAHMKRYPSGLETDVVERRKANRERILEYFGGTAEDWEDHEWHLAHVIKDADVLADLLAVSVERRDAVAKALGNRIPFGITPYYLSLMDTDETLGLDHAVRAQVLPPPDYVDKLVEFKDQRDMVFDFMGEHDTSPVDLVTRRYPVICILKPFNTCPQICVYCQRNWEIDECMADDALAPEETIDRALAWLDEHPGVGEVLVTGGDPMVMQDDGIEYLLERLAGMKQIFRVRFGTRTPVTLPMRWNDDLLGVLSRYIEPGVREVAVVTHFSHSYEITPRAAAAVQEIRKAGMGVYNQEVFTIENSRRFETAKLRRDLRSIGVDPYYTFNMKGKEETRRLMVPIARILQERKEEARLMPGLDRTDEPVFNVPKLGKNHLRAWQDHRVVMIRPGGSRVYELHPWEKYMQAVPPYNYRDVPIYDYLQELQSRGEDPADYRTIWYYY